MKQNIKKILLALLVVVLGLSVFACKHDNPDNPDTPDTPDTPDNPDTPDTPTYEIENFIIELEEGALTRNYNENFDQLVTDFSNASEANVFNHLRVAVGDKLFNPANNPDASIYKMATGTYPIETYDGIGFKMRKVGEGKLDLSNLVLALRGDDAYDVFPINLSEAVDPDGDTLPELTEEYQELIVCPNLSIEDDTTEYQLAGGAGASGTKVLDKILGFHLYLTGECAQIIEIEEVFLVKGGDKQVLDAFNRERVNKADDTCWWRDSRGFIVSQGFDVSKANYSFSVTPEHANIVLKVMGDTSTATINNVPWADLKDPNGNKVASAVNGAFHSLVINLELSGITGNEFTIASEKELVLSQVFFSGLEDREPVTVYPVIDTTNVAMFDNFNRIQSGFDGDYDKSSADPIVIEAGLNYALSYHNGDKVTVADGVVTFDATEAVDYINFKEGKTNYDGQKYLVLVVKAVDGATFNDFRFNVGNGITYINQMRSAFGLALPSADATDYVYTDADGFMWLIIDLAESNMEPNATDGFIDFYYSGSGKLMIDAIFYCDAKGPEFDEAQIASIDGEVVEGYQYIGAFENYAPYVRLEFTSESAATLESLRIEGQDGAKWFKNGEIIDIKGNAVSATKALAGLSFVIDVEASGLGYGWTHIHGGGEGVEVGTFNVKVIALTEKVNTEDIKINEISGNVTEGYEYCQGFSSDGANIVKMVFASESDATLEAFRIEGEDGAKWFKDKQIYDAKGNVIDATQKLAGLEITIDLTKSGLSLGWNHLHVGLAGVATGSFTVEVFKVVEKSPYEEIISNVVEGEISEGYNYNQGFSAEGDNLVRLEFVSTSDATLETLRLEGEDGAKWFKDGAIVDENGNAIDATQKLAGLSITIDMTKSGLSLGWNHLHGGGAGAATGTFTMTAVRLHVADQYASVMAALTK